MKVDTGQCVRRAYWRPLTEIFPIPIILESAPPRVPGAAQAAYQFEMAHQCLIACLGPRDVIFKF